MDASYFDRHVYKERMRITIELFLLHANRRGGSFIVQRQYVYAFVVGLGLGAWKRCDEQVNVQKIAREANQSGRI